MHPACDVRLEKDRSALEDGADPTVVSRVDAGRSRPNALAAERLLIAAKPIAAVRPEDVRALVQGVGHALELARRR